MIFEMRTYTLKPGTVSEFEKSFSVAMEAREKYSLLGGMWHTVMGPLNQVIHIWPYDNLQERADIRAASLKDESGKWPPTNTTQLLKAQHAEILEALPNVKPWSERQQWGSVYEMQVLSYDAADLEKAAAAFNEALPAREALYPVVGIFTVSLGDLSRIYQIFPYKDWKHRQEVREAARERSVWPPVTGVRPLSQSVLCMEPASFSRLQ